VEIATVRFRRLLFVAAAVLVCDQALAFDKWKAYSPPPLTCSDGYLGLSLSSDGKNCVQISGDATEAISNDSEAGNSYSVESFGRAALIFDERGAVSLGSHFSSEPDPFSNDNLGDNETALNVTEAFGRLGDERAYIEGGLLDSQFDSLAANANDIDWLTDLYPPFIDLYGSTAGLVFGGLGLQGKGEITPNISTGIGIENMDGQALTTGTKHTNVGLPGTVVAFARYNDGPTEGKATVAIGGIEDGHIDAWNLSAFAQGEIGSFKLLGTGYAASTGDWSGVASGKLSLGEIFLALDAGLGSMGREIDFSADLGDPDKEASVGISGRYADDVTLPVIPHFSGGIAVIRQTEVDASILPLENLKLQAALGRADTIWIVGTPLDDSSLVYGKLSAAWQPTTQTMISAVYTTTSLGGQRFQVSAEERK